MLSPVTLAARYGARVLQTTSGPRWRTNAAAGFLLPEKAGKSFVAILHNPNNSWTSFKLNFSSGAGGNWCRHDSQLGALETKAVYIPAPVDAVKLDISSSAPLDLLELNGVQIASNLVQEPAELVILGSPRCKWRTNGRSWQAHADKDATAAMSIKPPLAQDWLVLLDVCTDGEVQLLETIHCAGYFTLALDASMPPDWSLRQSKFGQLAISARAFTSKHHEWAATSGITVWNV